METDYYATIPAAAITPSGRLRVPHQCGEQYVRDYNAGWSACEDSENGAFSKGTSSDAFDDGYLDRASRDNQKWHLPWCTAHHNAAGGCGRA